MTATSIPDVSGRPEHMLVMVEDVTTVARPRTGSRRLSTPSAAPFATLEKLDRTKTEFLSIVSHEFRTALTGIQGFSELIRDGGLETDEVRAYGGYIFNDADRVNRLIGDMLDLDRMESGRMSIRLADVDINEVVSDVMTRAASSSSVISEFKADLDPRLPIVTGDRDRLVQVVTNLVNNAVKYSPDGGTVTLSTRADGGFALVSVTDTGLGIADDDRHVFERFPARPQRAAHDRFPGRPGPRRGGSLRSWRKIWVKRVRSGRRSQAGIGHADERKPAIRAGGQRHRPAVRGVFDGVVHQLVHHLDQPVAIACDDREARIEVGLELGYHGRRGRGPGHDVADHSLMSTSATGMLIRPDSMRSRSSMSPIRRLTLSASLNM